jgi:arginine decarboxylase-like protein
MAAINGIYDAACAGDEERRGRHEAVYHMNLSIFKSMPDAWAIGQLFPMVPLHRLDEEPSVRAILSDLTCDSDGKITSFVGKEATGAGSQNYVRVHRLRPGEAYYMGMFLGGAYQEALGSLHNLFGSPAVVEVTEGLRIIRGSCGQTIGDVLKLMKHDPISMLESFRTHVPKALGCANETADEDDGSTEPSNGLIHTLACAFDSSTYLTTTNATISASKKGPLSNAARLWDRCS